MFVLPAQTGEGPVMLQLGGVTEHVVLAVLLTGPKLQTDASLPLAVTTSVNGPQPEGAG